MRHFGVAGQNLIILPKSISTQLGTGERSWGNDREILLCGMFGDNGGRIVVLDDIDRATFG
jgi:hypothetical protein